jgi:tRNA-splicing ligase RtcB (3'-phosphate/5'-hydroxy nucleic acid ligase)
MDHSGEFVWLGDGDEAEIFVAAPDEVTARFAFERAFVAAGRLPGAVSPVCVAATSRTSFGWVAASDSRVAPDLGSIPSRSVLLVADVPVSNLGVPPAEVMDEILRAGLPELSSVRVSSAGVRRVCEFGGEAAAEDGLIEEEDLAFLAPFSTDSDSLGRRAVSAGEREWNGGVAVRLYGVGNVFDSDAMEALGVEAGMLAVEVTAGAGELGRISSALHRERVVDRVENGDFDAPEGLPVAPLETEEARDAARKSRAAANYADGRVALALYALRRAMRKMAGNLDVRAAWRVGGVEETESFVAHRRGFAGVGGGDPVVSGGVLSGGVGTMYANAPPFGMTVEDGRWLWEEAGLLERWADLDLLGGEG